MPAADGAGRSSSSVVAAAHTIAVRYPEKYRRPSSLVLRFHVRRHQPYNHIISSACFFHQDPSAIKLDPMGSLRLSNRNETLHSSKQHSPTTNHMIRSHQPCHHIPSAAKSNQIDYIPFSFTSNQISVSTTSASVLPDCVEQAEDLRAFGKQCRSFTSDNLTVEDTHTSRGEGLEG